jgi:CBS domain-containing protein
MNIAFFLLPKDQTIYLNETNTMRQALERMEYHRFTAVPILDGEGRYVGTLTEGDLLWHLKSTPKLTFDNCHRVPISDIPKRMNVEPIRIYGVVEDLYTKAVHQNFVPVIDDQDIFIGIIRRSDIINHLLQHTSPSSRPAAT